jgi:2-keto-3-deoxy-L-rhamnonate aldolase RhmA
MMLPVPEIAEAIVRAGYDFVGLDYQHGAHDYRTALQIIQLLDVVGVASYVRINPLELSAIARLADFGATGFVLAMCDGPAMVEAAVAAVRYQPDGTRSYAGQRYGLRAEPADLRLLTPELYPMIETRQAVDRIDEILAIPGVSGVHVGRADLSLSFGDEFRDGTSARVNLAVERVLDATRARGLHAAIHVRDGAEADAFARMGFDQLVLSSDIALLRMALARELAIGRGARPSVQPG